MTSLPALIEKLRDLKGPDREVDALIAQAFGDVYGLHGYADEEVEIARRYTASLDATISLIERELPGYSWGARKMINGLGFATITRTDSYHDWFHGCCSFCRTATAETPTLALLLAFLTAIKERDA